MKPKQTQMLFLLNNIVRAVLILLLTFYLGINNAVCQKKQTKEKTFTLIVQREKNKFIGRWADINLFFNEQLIGSLENGDTKTFILKSTKSTYGLLRAESSNIVGTAIIGGMLGDTSIVNTMRKEIRIKTNSGSNVEIFCTFNESGIYIREIEL